MIRILTWLLLGMFGYFILRNMLRPTREAMPRPGPKKPPEPEDRGAFDPSATHAMVEDPVCHAYVPAENSPFLIHQGGRVAFCSETCRQTFLERIGPPSRPAN